MTAVRPVVEVLLPLLVEKLRLGGIAVDGRRVDGGRGHAAGLPGVLLAEVLIARELELILRSNQYVADSAS